MSMSPYFQSLRAAVGHTVLVVPGASGIVFNEHGHILLVHQRDMDQWSTPGGAIEPHESPADAVVRELWEETGLHVAPVGVLGVWGGKDCSIRYPNGDLVSHVVIVFECAVLGGTFHPTQEVSETAFVGPADLPRYCLTPWAQRVLPELFQRPARARFDPATWDPQLGSVVVEG